MLFKSFFKTEVDPPKKRKKGVWRKEEDRTNYKMSCKMHNEKASNKTFY